VYILIQNIKLVGLDRVGGINYVENVKDVIKALKADHKTSPKSSAQQTPRDTHGTSRYKEEYEQLVAFRNLVKWLQIP
jgi:hypothetical protein